MASGGKLINTFFSIKSAGVNTVASKPVSLFTSRLRNKLSGSVGSVPARKTSFTDAGQLDVGNIPERSHTRTFEMPAGTSQVVGGIDFAAYWMIARHNDEAILGEDTVAVWFSFPLQTPTNKFGV